MHNERTGRTNLLNGTTSFGCQTQRERDARDECVFVCRVRLFVGSAKKHDAPHDVRFGFHCVGRAFLDRHGERDERVVVVVVVVVNSDKTLSRFL